MNKNQILLALAVLAACAAAVIFVPKAKSPDQPLKPKKQVGEDLIDKAQIPPTKEQRRHPKLIAPKRPMEFVIWAVDTPTPYLSAEAVEVAGRIGADWSERLVVKALLKDEDGEFDDYDLAVRALHVKAVRGDPDVLPQLVTLVRQADWEWEVDLWAARALAAISGDEALAALLPLANREDEDEEATWEAVYALGARGSALAKDAIKALLDHSDDDFATFAAGALLKFGDTDAKKLVEAHFADVEESDWDEEYLANGLGIEGSAAAIPYLFRLTAGEDRDEDLRMLVARSLGRTKHKDAIVPLKNLLADEDDEVKVVAAAALARDLGDATGAPILVQRIRSAENLELCIEAAKALLTLKREEDQNLWRQMFDRELPKENGLILRLWAAFGMMREE